jgi:hypothetical protein
MLLVILRRVLVEGWQGKAKKLGQTDGIVDPVG